MGRPQEAKAPLPTALDPAPPQSCSKWLRWLQYCTFALICFLFYRHSVERPKQPISHDNDTCPQVPAFELPISNVSLSSNDSKEIDLPSSSELAKLLSGAVQVDTTVGDDWPTVTQDPARWEKVFAPFHDYLRTSFPRIYADGSPIKLERVNEWGLVYTFPGSNESLAPLVLMAHQDVVPVEPETIPSWTHPPFSGFIDNELGLVWGRGAGDCKASLISILATLESLLKSNYTPERTVVCSFGFDEESSGTQGGIELAKFLHQRYGDNGVAMIVDEGGQIDLSLDIPVAAPAVAEKGYLDARLTVYTPGGHSSAPRLHTSIGLLAQLITLIEAHPFTPSIDLAGKSLQEVNPALQYLQCTRDAPKADRKLSTALKNLASLQHKVGSRCKWIERKLQKQAKKVLKLMTREQRFGFQTTQAVDLVSGGVKINALPEQASAVVNHRIDVTSNTDDVRKHIYRTVLPVARQLGLVVEGDGTPQWSFISSSKPGKKGEKAGRVVLSDAFNSALEPAPFTPLGEAKPWVLLQGVMRAVWKDILVAPDVMGGNTDTKSYWKLTKHIFRFSPGSDLPFPIKGEEENIHTVDERTTIHGLIKATEFYKLLIQAVGSQHDL